MGLPYAIRGAIKVSGEVLSRLRALASKLGVESPNALLTRLLEDLEPSLTAELRVLVEYPWVHISHRGESVALNVTQRKD